MGEPISAESARGPRRRLTPEARQSQLLSIAIRCCAQGSLDSLRHTDIAKNASVSTATVFNYFPTRQALLDDVLIEIERIVTKMFERLWASPDYANDSAAGRFMRMASTFNALVDSQPDVVKAFLNWSVTFNGEVRPQYIAFQDRMLELIIKSLPEALRSRDDARMVYGAANMFATMRLDNFPEETLKNFVSRVGKAMLMSVEP